MSDLASHLAAAARNQLMIDHLKPDIQKFSDWIAVVAFYKALHLVEALLASGSPTRHGQTHKNRELILKRDRRFQQIYRHYRPLYAASLIARYLENYSSFNDYMSPGDVDKRILSHYLVQVEKSVEKLLP